MRTVCLSNAGYLPPIPTLQFWDHTLSLGAGSSCLCGSWYSDTRTRAEEAVSVTRPLNDHSIDANSVRTRTEHSHVQTGMSEWVQIGSDSARGEHGHERRLPSLSGF